MPDQDDRRQQEGLIVAMVAVIAVVTMVFGFWGLKKSVYGPFSDYGHGDYRTPEEQQAEALALLKTLDTDGDSLSDYDEIYIYRTNPYLEDTDSDGIPDGEEVRMGSDPTCPKGTVCRVEPPVESLINASQSGLSAEEIYGADLQTMAFIEVFGDPRVLSRAEAEAKVMALPADDLRGLFAVMGVDAEAVMGMDEALLRQLALEALKEITFVNDPTQSAWEGIGR